MEKPGYSINMSYEEKKDLYNKIFTLGVLNDAKNVNDKLILISLLSLTYIKLKEKKPNITPLDIILSITKQKADGSYYYHFLEALAILVDDFSYLCNEADNCGLKTSQEIINKIKEILDSWTPF